MRLLTVVVALGACSGSPERLVFVDVTPGTAHARIVDLDCEAACPLTELGPGECTVGSDVPEPECTCHATSSCPDLTAVALGDGPSVRIEGCGEAFELDVAVAFPAAPVATTTPLASGFRISWEVDASARSVHWDEPGTLGGSSCIFGPGPGARETPWIPPLGVELTAVAEPVRLDSPLGPARVRVERSVTIRKP